MTNNLGRTPVAANQGSTVFDSLEDNIGKADAKLTAFLTVTSNSTTPSLTATQMRGYAGFILNGAPSGAVTLSVNAVSIGRFTIVNTCGQTVTVQITGQPVTAPTVANGAAQTFVSDGVNVRAAVSAASAAVPFELVVAVSDETTALTTGTAKVTFRMPRAVTLTGVRASLVTAQSSGSIFTVDINEGGSTILSTKLTIDNGEKTSTTAATAAVISDTSLADDAEITIDIDQVGDGTAKGLKVALLGTR